MPGPILPTVVGTGQGHANHACLPLDVTTVRVFGMAPCFVSSALRLAHSSRRSFRATGAQAHLVLWTVDVEHPDAGGHSGRNANVALGIGPVAADGHGVGGRGMEA